jgi:hypothetical protein
MVPTVRRTPGRLDLLLRPVLEKPDEGGVRMKDDVEIGLEMHRRDAFGSEMTMS